MQESAVVAFFSPTDTDCHSDAAFANTMWEKGLELTWVSARWCKQSPLPGCGRNQSHL